MTASQLLARTRGDGGRVWLDRQGRLRAKGITDAQLAELRASRYLVTALLREEIASLRWEHSGKDSRLVALSRGGEELSRPVVAYIQERPNAGSESGRNACTFMLALRPITTAAELTRHY